MNRDRMILILQAAVCVLLAVLLAAGAVCICRDGLVRRAENPLENVYTPENTAGLITAAIPLLIVFFVLLVTGLVLGVKDPKADRPAGTSGPVKPAVGPKNRKTLQAVFVVMAAGFIAAGILNGSVGDVLIKAIHICTECIGLG